MIARLASVLIAVLTAGFAMNAAAASFITQKSYDGKRAKTAFVIRDTYPVTGLAWSGDGKYLASASTRSNLVHIWAVSDRKRVRELQLTAAPSGFHSLSWSADGRFLAVCDGGTAIRVVRASDWYEPRSFDPKILGGCLQSAFSSDGRQLAVLNNKVHVLDIPSGRETQTFDPKSLEPASRMRAIAFVPGAHTLVLVGSAYVTVQTRTEEAQRVVGVAWIINTDSGTLERSIQVYRPGDVGGGAAPIVSVAIRSDARQFATGTRTGDGAGSTIVRQSAHVLAFPSGELLGAPLDNLPFGAQQGLTYTADGQYLIVGHQDSVTKAIHVIETRTLRVVDELSVSDAVSDVAADPSKTGFAAAFGRQIAAWTVLPRN